VNVYFYDTYMNTNVWLSHSNANIWWLYDVYCELLAYL